MPTLVEGLENDKEKKDDEIECRLVGFLPSNYRRNERNIIKLDIATGQRKKKREKEKKSIVNFLLPILSPFFVRIIAKTR